MVCPNWIGQRARRGGSSKCRPIRSPACFQAIDSAI